MSTQGNNMIYLGLCVRYQPPIIGIHYKNKQSDPKKKVYTIVLQRLILNPNPIEVADQLYLEHPHILKQNKIPKQKIAALVHKIQQQLKITEHEDQHDQQEYDDQQYQHQQQDQQQQEEEQQHQQEPQPVQEQKQPQSPVQKKRPKFDFDKDFGKDDGPANRSF